VPQNQKTKTQKRMIAKLLITKVRPDSFTPKTGGDPIKMLDLVCTDLGDGSRLNHSVIFSVGRHQKAQLLEMDLRDKTLELDVEGITVTTRGEVKFTGTVLNTEKLNGGRLTVEKVKPAEKAA
jgi:hypothetical protein